MKIEGRWHSAGSAKAFRAIFLLHSTETFTIQVDGAARIEGEVRSLKIPQRLGKTERKITLANGSLFVTHDNDAIDEVLKMKASSNTLIYTLESRMRWVLVSIILTITVVFVFFKWGIPWSAQKIAQALPYETNRLISGETMAFLDKHLFTESNLSQQRQQEIREHFRTILVPVGQDKEIVYTLHFRKWSDIPNAFALPSGDIFLTDKFVRLANTQDEVDAVLLHEMGHVVYRHGLETVIESTFISVAVMLIVGDSNALGDMGVGIGSFLVTGSYSRVHESEADRFAFEKMLELGIDPASFKKIMEKITQYDGERNKIKSVQKSKKGDEYSWLDYLSSHPATEKRTEIADAFNECFKKGLKRCDSAYEK